PHPPHSPLFPSTTLFRSPPDWPASRPSYGRTNDARVLAQPSMALARSLDWLFQLGTQPRRRRASAALGPLRVWPSGRAAMAMIADRKSTRLNSSHVSISY